MTRAAEWTGAVGDQWSAEWRRTDRSFAGLAPQLDAAILAVAPETGWAIDLGCGAGATALAIASARPSLRITGVDLSPALTDRAGERGDGIANLDFRVGDAAAIAATLAPVDLFFSRHGVMFYDDPVVALTALRRAAGAGAYLVFSCFRSPALNPWAAEIVAAITGQPPAPPPGYAPGPFAFANPAFVVDTLTGAGWSPVEPQPADFLYRAGEGPRAVDDALDFFTRIGPAAPALRAAAPADRAAMLDRMRGVVERFADADTDTVDFPAAAWVWTARA